MIYTYTASNLPILNPERGFYLPYHLPGAVDVRAVRHTGHSLIHIYIHLDPWRESDIPAHVLDEFHANFAAIRQAGLKVILRFTYNFGPYPDSEPDASKEMILRHIQQLTPFLQNNADVIAWLEAGLIGAWGEWHTSTNGLDNIPDKKDILFALLDALPPTRAVQVRYPANIIEIFPQVLTAEQAFGTSYQARVGHHNDCFLASDTDEGTYQRGDVNTIEQDQAYLAELTRFTPMSGETCKACPPRSECPTALQEMALLHFSSINEDFHSDVVQSWKAGGCFDEIFKRLGYRLTLTHASFNQYIRPGGILTLEITLTNTGFAAPVNARPLYIVLDGLKRYAAQVHQIDPRRWDAGQSSSFQVQLSIPSADVEGAYRLALWMPDAAESLKHDPRYAIQFANENTWDQANGFNVLGKVYIAETADGESQPTDEFNVINAVTGVATTISNHRSFS